MRRAQGWRVHGPGSVVARAALALLSFGLLGVTGFSPGTPAGVSQDAGKATAGRSFVMRAKAVYPATPEQPGPLERGMVIVRDGRIVAVGQNLELPVDLPLIDLRDEVLCPGFVSAGSALAGQRSGPQSVSGAFHALDAFDDYDDYAATLARGTTTVHLSPGEQRLVSGVGAVVKLAGPPEERTLVPAADLTVNLGVFNPPLIVEPPFYASSDVPIEPGRRQRPDSRLGQFLELEERIAAAEQTGPPGGAVVSPAKFDIHTRAFGEAWKAELPLRIQVERATDIEGALAFIARHQRPAYLVGAMEIDRLQDGLRSVDVPVVLRIGRDYRSPGADISGDPDALEMRLEPAGRLAGLRVALAGAAGDQQEDLRMAAILAVRGGMPPDQALAAITRVPAEILHVEQRVGSLAPGKDADMLVLTGEPLDINSFVRRAYVGGRVVFDAPEPHDSTTSPSRPLVVRAGTIWIGDGTILRDGSILVENGKIQAVGQRVPHPPRAQIIDAGRGAFLAPGFIDAHGHLGLAGDKLVATPDLAPYRAVAVAGREFRRVARAGVTTVLQAPYRGAPNGARMSAIKTFGHGRGELVARELAGVRFSLRGQDPLTGTENLRKVLQAGKSYDEEWKKYEAELAKWKESGGKPTSQQAGETGPTVEQGKPDPITGRWEYTLRGDPLPQPVSGTIVLKLTGVTIEGRVSDPTSGEEARVTGTLSGNDVTLEVDVETPIGKPTIHATIDRPDHVAGKVSVANISLDFDATRTDKSAVEFKVQRAKRTKDGRPAPPKLDPNREPFRTLLAGKVPAVVEIETAGQINAALKLFIDEFKVSVVLVGAEGASDIADQIVARKGGSAAAPTTSPTTAPAAGAIAAPSVGVVVPREIERTRDRKPYVEIADLARQGIRVALQSDSEDGARDLPLMALFAVRQGLGGDEALRALTIDAARMYKLDDRLGSLEPGKDADLLIYSGYPFDAGSRLERVIVGGREVPDE